MHVVASASHTHIAVKDRNLFMDAMVEVEELQHIVD
jgi:hypothetical protein